MPNRNHYSILLKGCDAWNAWRRANPHLMPLLSELDLRDISFHGFNLANVTFSKANLRGVDFQGSDLYQAEFYMADLANAVLDDCNLSGAKFHLAQLNGASLQRAVLFRADFIGSGLAGANFEQARCHTTTFASVDLNTIHGLDEVSHTGPSNIDIATLLMLRGAPPRKFLQGAGIPTDVLDYLPYFTSESRAINFYSCFISYSHKDEELAKRLYARLCKAGLRVWFAPEELKGGERLFDQIDQAIQVHDKLLLVLSEASMESAWVEQELLRARAREIRENRRVLFPIRLVPFEVLRRWSVLDADSGRDVAREVRAYFIPDFSDWQNEAFFEEAVAKLLVALRGGEPGQLRGDPGHEGRA